MRIKTSEATPIQLDWLVAKIEGYLDSMLNIRTGIVFGLVGKLDYSTNWKLGGPIIERELIQTNPKWNNAGYEHPVGNWSWEAFVLGPDNLDDNFESAGPTPLIAAMRCYVASKLGDEVEIPEELK